MMKKVMEIVEKICNMQSTDCRGISRSDLARDLMNLANIPQDAEIQEIPVDWDNVVCILFLLPNDNNYYGVTAGIGCNKKFCFELFITGVLEGEYFHFFEEDGKKDKVLPIDYFLNRKSVENLKEVRK